MEVDFKPSGGPPTFTWTLDLAPWTSDIGPLTLDLGCGFGRGMEHIMLHSFYDVCLAHAGFRIGCPMVLLLWGALGDSRCGLRGATWICLRHLGGAFG